MAATLSSVTKASISSISRSPSVASSGCSALAARHCCNFQRSWASVWARGFTGRGNHPVRFVRALTSGAAGAGTEAGAGAGAARRQKKKTGNVMTPNNSSFAKSFMD